MKIIICIKQIPDTKDVRWSKDNNIIRDGLISILNPYDVYAALWARKIKEKFKDTEITLLSMGPNSAIEAMRYAFSLCMGDRGVLLCDKKFSGADTLATSKTLSLGIKKIGDFDLILTGQFALDGDTAQTPYSLGNILNIPHIGYVNEIEEVFEDEIVVKSTKDSGIYKIKGKFPLVLSISGFNQKPYIPLAKDYIAADKKEIKILSATDIEANLDEIGIKGSPTYVFKAFRPENKRICEFKKSLIGEIK